MTQNVPDLDVPDNAKIEIVDPETAAQWLVQNRRNRNLRRRLVNTYAADMKAGRWQFTGDAIKFGRDGSLHDGQHRLEGIVQSGVTLPMLVVRELRAEAQSVMDIGAKRTAGDALSLLGEQTSATLASVASLVITKGGLNRRTVSTAEIVEVIEDVPSIRTAVEAVHTNRIPASPPSVLGYVFWRFAQLDPGAASRFFDSLHSLQGLPAGSPILALHHRLVALAGEKRARSHAYRQELICCFFHTWNAWKKNQQRTQIKVSYTAEGRIAIPKLRD